MMDSLEFHKIARRYPVPDYVTEEAIPSEEELESLPRARFADPSHRKYPTHTKAATWLSLASYWDDSLYHPNAGDAIGEHLSKAAQFWDIEEDERQVLTKVAKIVTEAEDAQAFALEETSPAGTEVRRFVITTPEDTLKSAQSLYDERTMLPLPWKRKAAERILKAAADQHVTDHMMVEAAEYLERAAGRGISSLDKLAEAFMTRRGLLKAPGAKRNPEAAETMAKMAQAVRELPESDLATCRKAAEAIDIADRRHRLFLDYDNGLELPEVSCHFALRKHAMAKAANYVVLPGGRMYKRSEVERVAKDVLQIMPDDARGWVRFDGQLAMDKVAEDLPRTSPDRLAIFERVCHDQGILPEKAPKSFSDLLLLEG